MMNWKGCMFIKTEKYLPFETQVMCINEKTEQNSVIKTLFKDKQIILKKQTH